MSSSNLPSIYFHYLVSPFSFSQRNELKRFLFSKLKKESIKLDAINIIFCLDAYLLELNQHHLKHDTLTDIITFELQAAGEPLLADIYISIDRVRENSKEFKTSFENELHRVIFHGVLHLCGHKDKKPGEKKLMRSMEDRWLEEYLY